MTTNANDPFIADTMVDAPVMSDIVPPLPLEVDEDGCFKGRFPCLIRSRNFWVFASGLILLMAGMLGLVLVLYNHPSLARRGHATGMAEDPTILAAELTRIRQENDGYYRNYRTSIAQVYQGSYGPYMFMLPNSPQKLAIKWMAYSDTLRLPYNSTGANSSSTTNTTEAPALRWMQRFALMTIYFDNDGDDWAVFGGGGGYNNSSDILANTTTNTAIVDDADLVDILTTPPAVPAAATIGSRWSNNIDIHECEWALVECDEEDHVIKLDFSSPAVKLSRFSKEIGFLHRLRYLDISKNLLKGIIPNEIFGLTSLEYLDLADNAFVSTIDTRIGALTSLTYLDVAGNLLTGEIPSTVQRLTNLNEFYMASNFALHGPILDYAVQWPNLKSLDVSETDVSGTFPTELGMLTNLIALSFVDTPFSGTIPSELGRLEALEDFVGGQTREKSLVGSLPTEISAWTNMEFFYIMGTSLTGSIPSGIGTWSKAFVFALVQSRAIAGTLPTELGLMTNLEKLLLYDTGLTGSIPSELGLLTNAKQMDFGQTKLQGTMPEELCDLALVQLTADCAEVAYGFPPQLICAYGTCCTDCYVT